MIPRIPEPELMDQWDQARAYAEEDFSEPNTLFVERFLALCPSLPRAARILDLGCGPADICLRLARACPGAHIDALDGSEAMLAFARKALGAAAPEVSGRVRLLHERLPAPHLATGSYRAVTSNSLLHHLHDPQVLWSTVRQAAGAGAAVLVMDLFRPADEAALEALVAKHAAGAPEVLRRDFRNSLWAAFTPEEVRRQLDAAGLGRLSVELLSDRHLAVAGVMA